MVKISHVCFRTKCLYVTPDKLGIIINSARQEEFN